jgi:uncharacterized protein (TIGR02266 family)
MRAAIACADQRRYERLDLEVEVDMVSDHNFFTGFSCNVSEGGIFVATHRLREVGACVEVTFTLPGDDTPIVARTEVKWVRVHNEASNVPPGMGLMFIDIAPESIARIAAFLRVREALFYED